MVKEHIDKYVNQIKEENFTYELNNDVVVEGNDTFKLTMGIISDIHMHPINPRQVNRTAEALNILASMRTDTLFINGDLTQAGTEIEFKEWNKVQEKLDLKNSSLHFTMGNHELAYKDTKDYFIKYYKELPETHYKINGYHIIKVSPDGNLHTSDYSRIKEWLKEQLLIAKADTGDLPIFVFFHHPIKDTYYSTRSKDGYWGSMEKTIFDDYPMAVTFSGHNHAPSNHPQAIWQDNFTAVNVPSMYYAEGPRGVGMTTYYEETHDAAQGLVIKADRTKVVISIYDFASKDFTSTSFEIDVSEKKNFVFTDQYGEGSLEPIFNDNSLIKVDRTEDIISVEFKQADVQQVDGIKDIVYKYKFILEDSNGHVDFEDEEWSHWIKNPMPDTFVEKFTDFDSKKDYKLFIYPYNAFGKKGSPLVIKIGR